MCIYMYMFFLFFNIYIYMRSVPDQIQTENVNTVFSKNCTALIALVTICDFL